MMIILELILYISDFITFLFLLPTNMFIFIVNFLTWIKDKKLPQVDQLIISISACKILEEILQGIRLLNMSDNLMMVKIYMVLFLKIMFCDVWFSTFLCVYFCLKIVNVKNTLYICLQRNFQKILPWLFVSVILGSVLLSVLNVLKHLEPTPINSTLNTFCPISEYIRADNISSFMILSWIAMLILSISALAIVTSLFKHINQVQQNFGGFRSPNMKAHVRVLRTVISFLISNIIILCTFTIILISDCNILNNLIVPFYTISKVVVCWSLIKGNRNLEKSLRNIFQKLRCSNTSNEME
ncbi:hypothetical protein GDO81_023129 [Engystomops pustulosus]|uniref:Taste receptor type 2 n=1 Tax=Engystomops pustulosus TaxID=76066 RepID=A0AAV6ZNM2_ENGPU|nr:hypothetical protein GDO81_023129 [Engystomops pustulosus]